MQAALDAISTWIAAPPVWPKAVISGVAAVVVVAWSAVWADWLRHDWAYWATSSGTLVTAIIAGVWRELPRGLPKLTPPQLPPYEAGSSDGDPKEERVRT